MTYADIKLLEIIEANLWLDRSSLIRSLLVSLLGISEFLELSFYYLILNLLEEQFRLTELGTSLEQICTAELSPLEVRHIDHLAELL